ncbi:unnamed protein product, partial [Nesidiocoris tenuis]
MRLSGKFNFRPRFSLFGGGHYEQLVIRRPFPKNKTLVVEDSPEDSREATHFSSTSPEFEKLVRNNQEERQTKSLQGICARRSSRVLGSTHNSSIFQRIKRN